MARRPNLEIDGDIYKNVVEVSFEIKCAVDETGRARDKARPGTLKIMRVSDPDGFFAEWASKGADALKSGKLTVKYYLNEDDTTKISFENGFITRYEQRIPNITADSAGQIIEHFEISCGKLELESQTGRCSTLHSPWADKASTSDRD